MEPGKEESAARRKARRARQDEPHLAVCTRSRTITHTHPLTRARTHARARAPRPQDSVRFLFGSHDTPHLKEEYRLRDLLPARFGPLDLLEAGAAPLLLQEQDNRLQWGEAAERKLRERRGDAAFEKAAAAALGAARRVGARGRRVRGAGAGRGCVRAAQAPAALPGVRLLGRRAATRQSGFVAEQAGRWPGTARGGRAAALKWADHPRLLSSPLAPLAAAVLLALHALPVRRRAGRARRPRVCRRLRRKRGAQPGARALPGRGGGRYHRRPGAVRRGEGTVLCFSAAGPGGWASGGREARVAWLRRGRRIQRRRADARALPAL